MKATSSIAGLESGLQTILIKDSPKQICKNPSRFCHRLNQFKILSNKFCWGSLAFREISNSALRSMLCWTAHRMYLEKVAIFWYLLTFVKIVSYIAHHSRLLRQLCQLILMGFDIILQFLITIQELKFVFSTFGFDIRVNILFWMKWWLLEIIWCIM